MKLIPYLLLLILLFSCDETSKKSEGKEEHIELITAPTYNLEDTLSTFLTTALLQDTLEQDNYDPFYFFKSGHLFTDTANHAIFIKEVEGLFVMDIWKQEDNFWLNTGHIDTLPSSLLSFNISFIDFNFDGYNDIFINTSCSNGYAMIRGYLIIVDPINKSLFYHNEVADFANFSVDSKRKIVIAEQFTECNSSFKSPPDEVHFKWKDSLLVEVNRINKCR
ncbi:hypothetical protein K6119_00445 [Paracrocinitomix mangrovi]|uniref:XAC2610-related protein n=1 Tax=Paracrocinitomix mangrovi TaxID=2862509 RepID=UPI001C8D732A|nr:hypothetical protein [Paracrocinitomix mangrovi]UKN01983.1 hypothetical protein K6119_00445 [Paracrocinitomix mangrovi]